MLYKSNTAVGSIWDKNRVMTNAKANEEVAKIISGNTYTLRGIVKSVAARIITRVVGCADVSCLRTGEMYQSCEILGDQNLS